MQSVSAARSAVTELEPEPQSAPRARAFVRQVLVGSRVEPVLDAAQLCVSELVTNAVLHADTTLRLEVRYTDPVVRLSVHDDCEVMPMLSRHTSTASTGRGLAMVAAVSDAWGVEPDGANGKTVWCELSEQGSGADVDINAVLDAWELATAGDPTTEVPDSSADETASGVVLQRYPVRLGLRLQEHYEAVVRECQLLAAPRPDAHPGVPERLLELALVLAQRYNEELSDLARPDPRRVAAYAHGLDVVDLTYLVGPDQVERLQAWQKILDDVDEFSRTGDLLAPKIPQSLALLRGWALTEFLRQTNGAKPSAWPGQVE